MASKEESSPETEDAGKPRVDKKTMTVVCGFRSPGPKYVLKTLVGYKDHCLSKERGPAFSIYRRYPTLDKCKAPGPSYLYEFPPKDGYTFGHRPRYSPATCTPGPAYVLPSIRGPAFTIGIRTKPRSDCISAGGYDLRQPTPGPAFTIGIRPPPPKCDTTPGGRLYSDKLVSRGSPSFTFSRQLRMREVCRSPGPKYNPKSPKPTPMFTFGMKHSICSQPYITECDDDC